MVSQEFIKQIFNYNAETGIFTRKITRSSRAKSGYVVGTKNTHGYLYVNINHKRYSLHRLAWLYVYGESPKHHIDHINRVVDDNRICNLREATNQQNSFNCKLRSDNTSGVRGVTYNKANSNWRAKVCLNGLHIDLGSFKSKDDAIAARVAFSVNNFREFCSESM